MSDEIHFRLSRSTSVVPSAGCLQFGTKLFSRALLVRLSLVLANKNLPGLSFNRLDSLMIVTFSRAFINNMIVITTFRAFTFHVR